jgi:hypothetical protein
MRIETYRSDPQKSAEKRSNPTAAPVAPIQIRIEGRRPDVRPEASTAAPPAKFAPPVNINRIETLQAPGAAGIATQTPGGVTMREMQREPGQSFGPPGEARTHMEAHRHPQSAQPQPSSHVDVLRVSQPRLEIRPAPSVVRPESSTMAVPQHEPAEHHHHAPQASPVYTEPAAGVAPRQPDAKAVARPKTGP